MGVQAAHGQGVAMAFEAQAQAARVVPQVQRPGASPRVDVKAEIQKSAMEKLRKSGRPEDAAAVFRSMKLFG